VSEEGLFLGERK